MADYAEAILENLPQLLFGSRDYAELNNSANHYSELLVSDERGPLVRWSGILEGTTFISGLSAPFGGPDIRENALRPSEFHKAVAELLDWSERQNFAALRLQLRPLYGVGENLVMQALLHVGFSVVSAEINQHVPLIGLATAENYSAALSRTPRKALRRCMARGDEYVDFAPEDWKESYDLLLENREAKGRSLQLDLAYWLRAREYFGEKIRVVGLRSNGQLVAAALLYRVLPTVELVVYWGDAGHELSPSPMHSLAAGISIAAARSGVQYLDLGISSVEGVPDDGLEHFKRTMLAVTSPRLVVSREVA